MTHPTFFMADGLTSCWSTAGESCGLLCLLQPSDSDDYSSRHLTHNVHRSSSFPMLDLVLN